jgi:UDP-glucose 4-epimerase
MNGKAMDIVTGGAGFIGSHLTEALLKAGRTVRVVDNFACGHRRNLADFANHPQLEVVEADVRDAAALKKAFAGADRVFHLAALADIVPSIQSPEAYFRTNVDGTFAVMEAARAANVRKVVYAASSSCYGIPAQYPTPETAPTDPRYPYALTKYLGEQIVIHWGIVYGMQVMSLRLFNVYGPRSRTAGTYGAVFGVFMAQLLANKPLTVVGDGTQTRDFVFVTDVARAFMAAADSDVHGKIVNVGAGNPVSVNRLVELLGAKDVVHVPKRPGEPDCTHADVSRITELLGWAPKVPFAEGVKQMLERIEYWREAPVWTPQTIDTATADWFKYLGETR